MQRVFLSDIKNNECFLNEEDTFHFVKVLRVKVNETFEGVYQNKLYLCVINEVNPLKVVVLKKLENKGELPNDVTLYFVASKGDKNDLVVQKCSELGVNHIIFLNSERSIMEPHNISNKLERYRKIALAASKQSRRMNVPSIEGIIPLTSLNKNDLKDHNFFAYETLSGTTKEGFDAYLNINKGESISVLVGAEGGFTDKEAKFLIDLGFKAISLGNRILRAETAAISILSNLSFFLERK